MNSKNNLEETKFITAILFNAVFNEELYQILSIANEIEKQMITHCKERGSNLDENDLEDIEAALMESLFLALAIRKQKLEMGE